jgi:hypothetical protein
VTTIQSVTLIFRGLCRYSQGWRFIFQNQMSQHHRQLCNYHFDNILCLIKIKISASKYRLVKGSHSRQEKLFALHMRRKSLRITEVASVSRTLFLYVGTKSEKTPSDQKENKSRVLPQFLFYRNVCLSLNHTHNYTCYAQSCFIGCLSRD